MRKKLSEGLKTDIAGGWLFKHSLDEYGRWLFGPNETLVKIIPQFAQTAAFGDDKFVGIDLIVEFTKENRDIDK